MILGEPEQTQYDLHFSILGIPVRIHPYFWLMALFMGSSGGLNVELLIWVGVVFFSIMVHEFGHALTMRYFGEQPRVVLHSMGGLAISGGQSQYGYAPVNARRRSPLEEIIVCFAGPAAGFLLAAIVIGLLMVSRVDVEFFLPKLNQIRFWQVHGIHNPRLHHLVNDLISVNVLWGFMNMLPVFPLDGGQIARQFFMVQDPWEGVRKSLWLSLYVAGGIAVVALVYWQQQYMAVMFAMLAYSSYMALQQMGGGRGRRW